MQACRVFRNFPALTFRTWPLPNTVFPCFPPDSDHGRSLAGVAAVPHLPEQRASALLQRTVSLLPRVLSGTSGPESSLFWSTVLGASIAELGSLPGQLPAKATIAICGFDEWACSHDLVTALLEDPFTSDSAHSEILRSRWKDAPSCVNIEYGKTAAFAGELSSPSDWLQRFPHAVRLTELPNLSSLSNISDETDILLLSCDVLMLLCDPVVTPLSDLVIRAKHLLNKPNTILILTSGLTSDPQRQFVSRTLSKMECQPGQILFVDPRQALDAVIALQAKPTSPSAVDKYQRDTLGSRISTISAAVNDILSPKHPSEAPLLNLRQATALSQVHSSLSASFRSIKAIKGDIDRVASEITDLFTGVQKIQENARHDVLGPLREDNKIENALSLSTRELNTLLGSLTFWKMVWRVDEVGALVSTAVERQWCKELESQLILQTGCLTFTQSQLSVSAFSLLSTSSLTLLRSPVLENRVKQLKHSPAHTLTPSSLTRSIHDRRRQLVQYTTAKLHREAQSAVAGAFGGILSGASLGWWLAFGEHILSLGAGTEIGTAIASGALVAVSGIRWAVGKWERAKRRWTQDSVRIGEGLARDLQRTVQQTVDGDVTIVASTACKGMQDLVDRRRNEIDELHQELCDLDAELYACAWSPASWTGQSTRSIKEVNTE